MGEGSERSAPIDRPSWPVNTPLRILTQQTNGLPGWWQPDSCPRTIPAPLGVMDKRNPSICQYVTSGAYLLPQPFHQSAPHREGTLTPALLAQPVIFHLSAHFFQIIVHVLVITSTITVKGEGVELEEGHSGLI